MKITGLQYGPIRAALLGAILASISSVAAAQKPAQKPQSGPPITTNGTVKSNPKADKGQATAEAARVKAREEKAEHQALKSAREEPKTALKGIRLTKMQEQSVKDIEKKYDAQYKDLAKAEKASDKAGTDDAAYLARIDALRTQERGELRALLSPEQQAEFDKNLVPKVAKKS